MQLEIIQKSIAGSTIVKYDFKCQLQYLVFLNATWMFQNIYENHNSFEQQNYSSLCFRLVLHINLLKWNSIIGISRVSKVIKLQLSDVWNKTVQLFDKIYSPLYVWRVINNIFQSFFLTSLGTHQQQSKARLYYTLEHTKNIT